MIKNKIWLSILWVVFAAVIWVFANFIFKWNTELNDFLSNFGSRLTSMVTNWKEDYNYVGNMNVELQIPSEWLSAKVNMKWIQMVSLDKMLKYRFWVDSIDWQISWWAITWFTMKALDFIVNEEKSYFKLDPEFVKKNYPMASMTWNALVTKYMAALEAWKYLLINKADKNLKMLWKLADDELVRMAVIWLATSNPWYYFEKNEFNKKLRAKLLTKGSYKLLFDETKTDWDKKYLKMKESVCELYVSVVEGVQSVNPALAMAAQKPDIQDCKSYVQLINTFTDWKLYVKEVWNQDQIVYEWMFNLNLNYGDWYISSSKLQVSWVWGWDYSNDKLDLNITPELLKASGHDLSIISKLDFNGKTNWNITLNYKSALWDANIVVNIADGKLKDWLSKWKIDMSWDVIDLNWQWDSNKWNLDIKLTSAWKDVWGLALKYEWKNVEFKINEITSWFELAFTTKDQDWKLYFDWNIAVKNPILTLNASKKWYMVFGEKWYNINELDMTWSVDFISMMQPQAVNLKLLLKYANSELTSKLDITEWQTVMNFSLNGKLADKSIDLKLSWDGIGTWKLEWNIKYQDAANGDKNLYNWLFDLKLADKLLFSLKIDGDYKSWWASYEIPTNFEPFDYEELIYSSINSPAPDYGTWSQNIDSNFPPIGTWSFDITTWTSSIWE